MNVNLPQPIEPATIHVIRGEAVGISSGFVRLFGYDSNALLGRQIPEVMMSTLKLLPLTYHALTVNGSTDGFVFSAHGQAREVTISIRALEDEGALYCIEEKPGTEFDRQISVLEPLFRDEFMSVALYSVPDYIVLKANKRYKTFFQQACGLSGDILGQSVRDYTLGCRTLQEKLDETVKNGGVNNVGETRFIGPDGQETYKIFSFLPIFVSGELKYIVETSKDATEHVRERLLKEEYLAEISLKNKLFEAVIENMHDALAIYDSEGKLSFCNARARALYPYFNENTTVKTAHKGVSCFDLSGREIPEDGLPTRRIMTGETVRNECLVILHRDWTKVVEVNATPIYNEAGEFISAVVTHHDMTDLLQNQQLIQTKDDMLREKGKVLARQAKMLDLSSEAIFAWESGGKIVYWNRGAERMYGFDSSEAVGRYTAQLLKTSHIEKTQFPPHLLEEDGEWSGLLTHTTKAGDTITVESHLQCILDESGEKLVLETNRDITERIKAEEALRESEMNYRMATLGYGSGAYAFNHLRNKGYWSDRYKEILGLKPGDALETDEELAFTGVHPEDRGRLRAAITSTLDPTGGGILDITYRMIRKDSAVRWIQSKGQTFFTAQYGKLIPYLSAGAIVDVTDEKAAEEQIRRISEELTHIIESTEDYILSIDKDSRIIFCNTAARQHFRSCYGRELSDDSLMGLLPMKTAISFMKQAREAALSEGVSFEIRTPMGERVVSYSVNPVYVAGECVEVTIFGEDITERQNVEREVIRLNASLEECVVERTAQLQQSVSDLKNITLILSHDLKSALRGIGMYAGEILAEVDIQENAQKIKAIYHELLTMVDGLTNYEKASWMTMNKQNVNLKKMIVSVFSELSVGTHEKAALEFETGLPTVMADSGSLRHAVMNILSNALKFAKPDRRLKLDVGCRAEDNYYVFYFRDNGIGFDMEYAEKIFGVFERLNSKKEYEGSGVGLAIVRNIIQRHGGRVWADSEPGIGTTLFISLPIKVNEDDACIG